jgi:peptidoglycan-N-acetylglucosamine deacetylase
MEKPRAILSAAVLSAVIGVACAFAAVATVQARGSAKQVHGIAKQTQVSTKHARESATQPQGAAAQTQATAPQVQGTATPTQEGASQPQATAAQAPDCPGHPDAIGTSRVITIDRSDYQRLGTLQYHQTLPLDDHEVVLTFDDGPIPPYSNQILDILGSQCVKATYFLVGEMAKAHPAVVRRIHDEGHAIGTHSQDHPLRFDRISDQKVRWEIDTGIDNVNGALGDAGGLAPFFRIPGFGRTDIVESELAARSLVVFSTDVVADDWFRRISASQIVARAISRLEEKGKGMLLLHDIHPWTVAALPGLLKALKDKGFHIVQVVPSATVAPGLIAGRSELTVAWSTADQAVMDDSGNGPAWPKLTDSPIAETSDLPAPDEGAFDPHDVLSRMASTADIEVDSPSVEAGTASSPWPYQALVELPSPGAQLPVPSVLDIGWPVQERPVVDAALEPKPSAAANDSSEQSETQHGRTGHARLIVHRRAVARPAAGQHVSARSARTAMR